MQITAYGGPSAILRNSKRCAASSTWRFDLKRTNRPTALLTPLGNLSRTVAGATGPTDQQMADRTNSVTGPHPRPSTYHRRFARFVHMFGLGVNATGMDIA